MARQSRQYVMIAPLTAAMFAVLGALAAAAFVVAQRDVSSGPLLSTPCRSSIGAYELHFYVPANRGSDRAHLAGIADIPQLGGQCHL